MGSPLCIVLPSGQALPPCSLAVNCPVVFLNRKHHVPLTISGKNIASPIIYTVEVNSVVMTSITDRSRVLAPGATVTGTGLGKGGWRLYPNTKISPFSSWLSAGMALPRQPRHSLAGFVSKSFPDQKNDRQTLLLRKTGIYNRSACWSRNQVLR